jgi:hypothetical protein
MPHFSFACVDVYRASTLILPLSARSDQDTAWDDVLKAWFGIVGVSGWSGQPRGVHSGMVIVEWASNIVFIVAAYSHLYETLADKHHRALVGKDWERAPPVSQFMGCFADNVRSRALPWLMDLRKVRMNRWSGKATVTFTSNRGDGKGAAAKAKKKKKAKREATGFVGRCIEEGRRWGHRFCGVQFGGECWCGGSSYGRYGEGRKATETHEERGNCARDATNAVYSVPDPVPLRGDRGTAAVRVGSPGQACDTVCVAAGLRCSDELLAVLGHDCAALDAGFVGGLGKGKGCTLGCIELQGGGNRKLAPFRTDGGLCVAAAGRFLQCSSAAAAAGGAGRGGGGGTEDGASARRLCPCV